MTSFDPQQPLSSFEAALRKTVEHPAMEALSFQLMKAPWAYDFYTVVRRIECVRTDLPRVGASQKPADDPVRFAQDPTLSFPPSPLTHFTPATPDSPARLHVAFMSFLGPHGPLPLYLTEYVRDRLLNAKDPTLARFLDFLLHRHVSLFYRAWAVNQQTVSFDRSLTHDEQDPFATYIASLFGIGMDSLRHRDALPDSAKLHYSGHLALQTRHADGLRHILQDYFQLPTRIVEFMGQWIELPPDARCQLGKTPDTGLLGSTAIVGSKIWACQYKFRIRLGPMSLASYLRLLPGEPTLQRLVAAVRNYLTEPLAWDVQLILKADEVPATQLGKQSRLGYSTWLKSQPTPRDAADLVLTPIAA